MKRILFMLVAICIIVSGCDKNSDDIIKDSNPSEPNTSSVVDTPSSPTPATTTESVTGDWYTIKTGNYMDFFMKPSGLSLSYQDSTSGYDWTMAITPTFTLTFDCNGRTDMYGYNPSVEDQKHLDKYNEYAKYFGDTSYSWYHDMYFDRAITAQLYSIDIVADKDFDKEHPAGTSLNNLFTLKYNAYHSYIKGNYKNVHAKEGERSDVPMDSVSVVTDFKGSSLFQSGAKLLLSKRPAKGKYTFTFTLNFGEDPLTGEKVEVPPASIEVEF